MPADEWPEVLAQIVVLYWLLFGPFPPNSSMIGRMLGTALAIGVAYNICERWEPSERAKPKTRFHFYLRIAGVYLLMIIGIKTVLWLVALSFRHLGSSV
ncbi:MAG TPA: hypothetical protein VGH19_23420 [Verrucomicrobiae bacterium]